MAKITKIVDDIDGSDATDTLEFSWGADNYTIDLNDKNADEFREIMALYISHATKRAAEPFAPRSGGNTTPARSKVENDKIRAWAGLHGHKVSPVGRIPESVISAYEADQELNSEDDDAQEEAHVIANIKAVGGA